MHLFNLCWLMVLHAKNWRALVDSALAFPVIAVALIGLLIIPVNPLVGFECWHVFPVWHFIAFQDLRKASLMLQMSSQEFSKNSWMRLSHSYAFTIQFLMQCLCISEILLKEHLGVAHLESVLVTPCRCTETCLSSPWLVLAHWGSAHCHSYVCCP